MFNVSYRGSSKPRTGSFRRSVRNSTKSADSGLPSSDMSHNYHSDTELRYNDKKTKTSRNILNILVLRYHYEAVRRGSTLPKARPTRISETTPPKARNNYMSSPRGNSLDRRKFQKDVEIEMDPILLANTPILCNKYVVGKNDGFARSIPGKGKMAPVIIYKASFLFSAALTKLVLLLIGYHDANCTESSLLLLGSNADPL